MQDIDYATLFLRWIHIVSAMAAIGGAIYVRFAFTPAAETLDAAAQDTVREQTRNRWSKFVHAAIALLLITGGINFVRLAMPPKVEPMPYHGIFGVKFLLSLGVFFIATALVGRSPAFAAMRQKSRTWLNALVLMGVLIVLLSGTLSQVRMGSSGNASAPVAASPAE
jgi:uncharacterized membrane protein